jgi:glycosyltransferase involved in cell wall biosynthesis
VLAVTDEVRADLESVHGVPPDRIDVIPYPIDLGRFGGRNGRGVRSSLGVANGDPLALFIGHDFQRKGLEEAIGSLVELADLHLVVVGEGDKARYGRLAESLGVGRRVHFAGSTTEPEQFFREADVFLLPTREDVWGISLVEAMAAGVPIVTTASAGAAGLVRAAGAGVVLEDGSPAVLGPTVGSLLADARARSEMGRRGRRAAAAYGEEAFARALLKAYEAVLAERRGGQS